jgi:hypothetical protein
VHCAILDGGYLVASLSLLYIDIGFLYALCQGVICSLPWVELLRVQSLNVQSCDEADQRRIHNDAPINPNITSMVSQQEDFNTSVNLLMSVEVGYLHYIQDRGLRELLYPRLGDYAWLLPSCLHQVPI